MAYETYGLPKKITSSNKKTKHDIDKYINCEDGEETDEQQEPDSGVPDDPNEAFGNRDDEERRMDDMILGGNDFRRNRSMVVKTMQKEEYKADKNIKSTK